MNCILRKWRLSDAQDLAAALNNEKIQNNLRSGLPLPYTQKDARDYIITMLSSQEDSTFAYNTGSRRALEKAGFHFEGMMKNNAVKSGKVVDMALYSLTRAAEPYPVRRLSREEIPAALELCWQVFLEFEAPEYSAEGIAAFRASLDDRERTRQLNFYGAFDGDTLVGVLCMRPPQHIGGFFVDAAYHRRGIGKKLFAAMRQDYARQEFTVNSSPYAVEIYRHLGFVPTGTEQCVDGLRFTPMHYPG